MRAHYESFDMVSRAHKVYEGEPIGEAWEHFAGAAFEDNTGLASPI